WCRRASGRAGVLPPWGAPPSPSSASRTSSQPSRTPTACAMRATRAEWPRVYGSRDSIASESASRAPTGGGFNVGAEFPANRTKPLGPLRQHPLAPDVNPDEGQHDEADDRARADQPVLVERVAAGLPAEVGDH